jgi:hypothetical protein
MTISAALFAWGFFLAGFLVGLFWAGLYRDDDEQDPGSGLNK